MGQWPVASRASALALALASALAAAAKTGTAKKDERRLALHDCSPHCRRCRGECRVCGCVAASAAAAAAILLKVSARTRSKKKRRYHIAEPIR